MDPRSTIHDRADDRIFRQSMECASLWKLLPVGVAGQLRAGFRRFGRDSYRSVDLYGEHDFIDRLREPRRQTPRNEFRPVDATRDSPFARVGLRRLRHLFPDARAAAISLPAVRKSRWCPLQLLPQLQMQSPPFLSQLQTRSRRNRQVLPLLRL